MTASSALFITFLAAASAFQLPAHAPLRAVARTEVAMHHDPNAMHESPTMAKLRAALSKATDYEEIDELLERMSKQETLEMKQNDDVELDLFAKVQKATSKDGLKVAKPMSVADEPWPRWS